MTATGTYPIERAGYVLEVPPQKPSLEMLAYAYLRFAQQDLLESIFWQQHPVLGIREYLDWASKIAVLGCYARRIDPIVEPHPSLAGLGVIQTMSEVGGYRRLEVGVMFFREFQRHNIPELFCWEMARWCFCDQRANMIYGVVAGPNRAMRLLSRRMGFVEETVRGLAFWKGKPVRGHIYSMSREEWEEKRGGRTEQWNYKS